MGILLSSVGLVEKELSIFILGRVILAIGVVFFAILTVVLFFKLDIKRILKFQKDNRTIIKMKSIPAVADDKEIQKIQKAEQKRIKKEKEEFEEAWQTAMLSESEETAALDGGYFDEQDKTDVLCGDEPTDILSVGAQTEILAEELFGRTDQLEETTRLSDHEAQIEQKLAALHFVIVKDIEISEKN